MLAGIVGKPSVGKSTFFSAVTLLPVKISSRPFTTTKPNRGIGYVRTKCVCKEFEVKDQPVNSVCIDGVRLIPVELIDCVGLVPGAHQGRGMGNAFLDELRRADVIIHIVDSSGSSDEEGNYCEPGTSDPINDIRFLEQEIAAWFSSIILKRRGKIARRVEMDGTDVVDVLWDEWSGLRIEKGAIEASLTMIDLNKHKPSSWKEEEVVDLSLMVWKMAKPSLIAANKIDLPHAEENLQRLRALPYPVVPCCAEAELVLRRAAEKRMVDYTPGDGCFTVLNEGGLTLEQRKALNLINERVLKKWGSTGVQRALNSAFLDLLNLITVYPVRDVDKLSDKEGRVLPDAHLVKKGTTARELAYEIHQELGEGFIYAIDARTKKRLGEDYTLKDGDVVKIVSAKMRG
jgi:hypothetical protein